MVVSEIMRTDVATCRPRMNVEQAIQTMLERDCGFLPVLGTLGTVVGVITDRDICASLASRRRTPAHVLVEEAMRRPVYKCEASDTVLTALGTMSKHRIRRLPVVDAKGTLQGVLSMDDLIVATTKPGSATSEDIVETLRVICRRGEPELVAATSPG